VANDDDDDDDDVGLWQSAVFNFQNGKVVLRPSKGSRTTTGRYYEHSSQKHLVHTRLVLFSDDKRLNQKLKKLDHQIFSKSWDVTQC
jgi:hypothetical protein